VFPDVCAFLGLLFCILVSCVLSVCTGFVFLHVCKKPYFLCCWTLSTTLSHTALSHTRTHTTLWRTLLSHTHTTLSHTTCLPQLGHTQPCHT
jgi:hypothetical protein